MIVAPSASDSPEIQADWLELLALGKADKNSAMEDLVREHRRSGSTDSLGDFETIEEASDEGSEKSQQVAEDTFGELGDRFTVCGTTYPFEVEARYIQARTNHLKAVYTFLLAISWFGKDAGPPGMDGADLFERVCAVAGEEYLGGSDRGVRSFPFGFPRRLAPAGFRAALDNLCAALLEGGKSKDRPTAGDQKDSKLDLVFWRPFGDGREGQLIAFAQCATGGNWHEKRSELQVNFCFKWMHDTPAVLPVRMFFAPFRIERRRWYDVASDAGIVFDRCRITLLTKRMPHELLTQCRGWTAHALKANL